MGAALLSTPDLLLDILRKLLDNMPMPISCKIRMLPEQLPTLHLVSRILRTGIRNLTVHCRTRDMRPGERAMWERLGDIVELGKRRQVPVTCNGDGEGWSNWDKIRTETGTSKLHGPSDARRRLAHDCQSSGAQSFHFHADRPRLQRDRNTSSSAQHCAIPQQPMGEYQIPVEPIQALARSDIKHEQS